MIKPNEIESYLSKKPPCPGNDFPESLTLKNLLSFEINKSPIKAEIEIVIVKKTKDKILEIYKYFKENNKPQSVPVIIPKIVPEYDLDGLIEGMILGVFIKLPNIYEKISVENIVIKNHKVILTPLFKL